MRRGALWFAALTACGRLGFDPGTATRDAAPAQTDAPACRALDASWTPHWPQLVAYEPFDGAGAIANTAAIPAVVGMDGVASNANGSGMTYVAGKLGQAIEFDGIDDYITLPVPNVDTTAGDSVTVSVWMRWNGMLDPLAPSTWTKLLLFTAPEYALVFASNGAGTTGFGFNTANSDLRGTDAAGLANTWVHVVAVFDNGAASSSSLLYLNGQPVAMSNILNVPQADQVSTSMLIAALPSWPSHYAGDIDELAVWNAVLSPAEVASLYAAQSRCP